MAKKWYIIQAYSGQELKVQDALLQVFKQHHKEDRLGEILIPSETVSDSKSDKKGKVRKKITFPGYIFAQLDLDESVWHLVKDIPKVSGFVGDQNPKAIPEDEIAKLRTGMVEGAIKPKPKVNIESGDQVKVLMGPFANFVGIVSSVSLEKQKLKVSVSIFGRPTSVELDFSAIEKV